MKALFKLENGILKPSEHVYGLKVFTDIIEQYPDEKDHIQIFKYIFYTVSLDSENNPFFNVKEEDKEEMILAELKEINFSTEDDCIQQALKFCEEIEITPIGRAYLGIKNMLDKVSEHLQTVSITSTGKDANLPALVNLASKFDSIRSSFEGTLESLKKEQRARKVRGNQTIGYDQKNY